MSIYVIIPAYNEEDRITETLEDYGRLLDKGKVLKVFVVSESTDGTDLIVNRYSRKHRTITLVRGKNRRGKGAAVLAGFERALEHAEDDDIVGFVDADDAVTAEQFLRLLSSIDGYDCIIGSRYVKGNRMIGKVGARRRIASRAYNILVKLLFGLHYNDTQCGAKLFKAGALRAITRRITVKGLGFDVNVLYELTLDGKKIKEYPIKYFVKNTGTSITVAQVIDMFFNTLSYRLSRSGARRRDA